MTDKQIVEAMAGIDEQYVFELTDHDHAGWKPPVEPDYLTSHDACHRVIDGLSDEEKQKMCSCIIGAMVGKSGFVVSLLMGATPREKCEAILKAKGMWQKD